MGLTREQRFAIHDRDEWKCWYCGREVKEHPSMFHGMSIPEMASIGHLDPLSRGGSDHGSNLVTACRRCNSQKATKTLEEYRYYMTAQASPEFIAARHLRESLIVDHPFSEAILNAIDWLDDRTVTVVFHGEKAKE